MELQWRKKKQSQNLKPKTWSGAAHAGSGDGVDEHASPDGTGPAEAEISPWG